MNDETSSLLWGKTWYNSASGITKRDFLKPGLASRLWACTGRDRVSKVSPVLEEYGFRGGDFTEN